MCTIIRFPQQHVLHGSRQAPCTKEDCMVCDGGLGLCVVCGCAEGEWTTHCCGYLYDPVVGESVYAGEVDYVEPHGWVKRPSAAAAVRL